MHAMKTETGHGEQLAAFVRNRYFYGKLLDVYHLELEQQYLNGKRWLINRLISGYGVVCGLNVECSGDGKGVIVGPGVGIDKAGYEIVVPRKTDPIPLPPRTKPVHEHSQHGFRLHDHQHLVPVRSNAFHPDPKARSAFVTRSRFGADRRRTPSCCQGEVLQMKFSTRSEPRRYGGKQCRHDTNNGQEQRSKRSSPMIARRSEFLVRTVPDYQVPEPV